MSPSAAPPTPQEIHRKLSVHSGPRSKQPPVTTTLPQPTTLGPVSGTESDSDSVLTPDITSSHVGFISSSYHGPSSMPPPLSSIAERSPASGGEDSDEEEEEVDGGWRIEGDVAARRPRGEDTVLKSGYLSKKGERRKTWKKRWFVLRPSHLAFYKNEAEYKLLRLLDLADVHSCIQVNLKRHDNSFGLILPKRTYYLQAGSATEVQQWVLAIEEARQALMATSTQTSATNPIPIPSSTNLVTIRPPPISVSPPGPNQFSHIVSSSDSDDATPHPPPPGEGQRLDVVPSPTNVKFGVSPTKVGPSSPGNKEATKTILSGYLMKCGSKRRNWRKRWFVLTAEKLFYSRSHMDTKPHRIFPFSEILDAMDYEYATHRHHPTVLSPSVSLPPSHNNGSGATGGAVSDLPGTAQRNFTFKIVMTKRNLVLCAPSEEDEIKWLGAVRALIVRRSGSGVVPGNGGQQQHAGVVTGTGTGVAGESGSGGIKNKVKRRSAGATVLTSGKSGPSDDVRDTQ